MACSFSLLVLDWWPGSRGLVSVSRGLVSVSRSLVFASRGLVSVGFVLRPSAIDSGLPCKKDLKHHETSITCGASIQTNTCHTIADNEYAGTEKYSQKVGNY